MTHLFKKGLKTSSFTSTKMCRSKPLGGCFAPEIPRSLPGSSHIGDTVKSKHYMVLWIDISEAKAVVNHKKSQGHLLSLLTELLLQQLPHSCVHFWSGLGSKLKNGVRFWKTQRCSYLLTLSYHQWYHHIKKITQSLHQVKEGKCFSSHSLNRLHKVVSGEFNDTDRTKKQTEISLLLLCWPFTSWQHFITLASWRKNMLWSS